VKHVLPSVRAWLALAAVALIAAFFLSYRSIRQSEVSTAAVVHTQQTLSALIALEGTVADLILRQVTTITRASEAATKRVDDLAVLTISPRRPLSRCCCRA
jgi:drug/metabolite transporter (DMT)-like permease